MRRRFGVYLTGLVIGAYVLINHFIDFRLQEVFNLSEIGGEGAIFIGLQLIQWMCTWSLPILFVTLILIWFRDLRYMATKLKRKKRR